LATSSTKVASTIVPLLVSSVRVASTVRAVFCVPKVPRGTHGSPRSCDVFVLVFPLRNMSHDLALDWKVLKSLRSLATVLRRHIVLVVHESLGLLFVVLLQLHVE
jgi:hypothetical protein